MTATRSDLVERLCGLLAPIGPVRAKAVPDGWGLCLHDLVFGIVAKDVLYLKADGQNRAAFEAEGLEPLVQARGDERPIVLSFRRAPDAAVDDGALLVRWVEPAIEAARRARAARCARDRRLPSEAGSRRRPGRPA